MGVRYSPDLRCVWATDMRKSLSELLLERKENSAEGWRKKKSHLISTTLSIIIP